MRPFVVWAGTPRIADDGTRAMSTLAYRREIDGLRAIAVAAVVLYHLDEAILPGGFAGVDVFFVLSGYLITSLLVDEHQATGRIDLMDFYARRVRRLLPALWVVITTVLLLSVVLLGPMGPPFHGLTDSALASLVFLANEYFLATAGDYFAGPAEQLPLLHLWSLAVEEQFYLVFPLLLWMLLLRGRRAAWQWLGVLSLASLLLAEHWMLFSPERAFFRTSSRFWELAAGALVALSPAVAAGASKRTRFLATGGLLLVLLTLVAGAWDEHFPGLGALPPVVGTAMLLRAIHVSSDLGPVGRLLSADPMVRLGLWSYALYLWHWPLLALERATSLSPPSLAWRAALCLLAVGLAGLTHAFIERPVRRGLHWSSKRMVLAGTVSGIVVIAIVQALGQQDLVPLERREMVARTLADRPQDMSSCHYGAVDQVTRATPPACAPGGKVGRVVVWGDSHALAMRPFADALARSRGTNAQPMTMDSCPPVVGPLTRDRKIPLRSTRCEARNRLALDAITAPGAYDVVVLGGLWTTYAREPGGIEKLSSRIEATLVRLVDVPEVVLIASVPAMRHPVPTCIAAGRTDECAFPRAEFEQQAEPLRREMRALAARFPNLTVVDPTKFFCNDRECPAVKDGYGLFWDDDHVSSTAALAFGEAYLADPARYTLAPNRAPGP